MNSDTKVLAALFGLLVLIVLVYIVFAMRTEALLERVETLELYGSCACER